MFVTARKKNTNQPIEQKQQQPNRSHLIVRPCAPGSSIYASERTAVDPQTCHATFPGRTAATKASPYKRGVTTLPKIHSFHPGYQLLSGCTPFSGTKYLELDLYNILYMFYVRCTTVAKEFMSYTLIVAGRGTRIDRSKTSVPLSGQSVTKSCRSPRKLSRPNIGRSWSTAHR